MIPLLPKASPILIGFIAGGLALGNLAIATCLRRISRPRSLHIVSGVATALEWLAALGMVLIGGANPMNPVPAVLILLILIDGLRFGLVGVAGATLAAEVGSSIAVVRQVVAVEVTSPAAGMMVLARWAVILLAAGLVIGLLLWKGQEGLRQEEKRWESERAALLRRLDDAERRSKDGEAALRGLQDGVSPRERQVLSLLAEGFTYRQIAGYLSIDLETVRTHVRHLAVKLRAVPGGRKAVVAAAKDRGLLPP
ncbi:MAG: LuxR C-terminal-related transcriptional regulator [Chloroflexota bacterium]